MGVMVLVLQAREKREGKLRPREDFIRRATLCGTAKLMRHCSYKKRSMIGPSFLIVAAGHNFRSVMIALSRA